MVTSRGSAPRAPRRAGYDLRAALVGSEGTLGIVAAACVRLTPLPPAVTTLLLDFPTIRDCAATVSGVIASGVVPAAMELMDRGIVEAVEAFVHAGYPTDAAAILIVEVDGTEGATRAQAAAVEAVARSNHVRTVRVAADEDERALLWKGRRNALGAVGRIAPHYYLHDIVVPRTRLADALAGFSAIGRRYALPVTCIAHAGDGNLHPHLHFDQREPGAPERVLAASEEIVRLAVDLGGSLSGEHGIGLEKRDFLPLVFSPEDLTAQACVRAAFDPERRMNPRQGPARRRAVRRGLGGGRGDRTQLGGRMELIHPHTKADVVEAVREANPAAQRLLVVGGRHHADKGNPVEIDAELWTTQLDRLVAYEPAEMIAVVEAGMRVGELDRLLAEGGQEWPSDAPADATVGGVIAAEAQSPRRLRVGRIADYGPAGRDRDR